MIARCQLDAYQRRLHARPLGAEPVTGRDDGAAVRVRVADTVLYPEGGGQPPDHGSFGTSRVLDVQREPDRPDAPFVLYLDRPVADDVELEMTVDWARRFDHMQQHTAQHLLTAIAQDRFGAPTVAFHLGVDVSTIDLAVDALSETTLAALADAANAIVREARPVTFELVEPEDYPRVPGLRSRGLPQHHTGQVRLVRIADLDLNTCGGTHVASTAELQAISLVGTERVRDGVRLSYVAGGRVLTAFDAAVARERALTGLVSCGPEAHVEAVERLLAEQRATRQQHRRMLQALAEATAERLAASSDRVLAAHRDDADMDTLRRIASVVCERRPEALVLLTAGEREGMFMLAGPPDEVARLGPRVAAVLAGRGGGARGRYQGRAGDLTGRAAAVALLGEG